MPPGLCMVKVSLFSLYFYILHIIMTMDFVVAHRVIQTWSIDPYKLNGNSFSFVFVICMIALNSNPLSSWKSIVSIREKRFWYKSKKGASFHFIVIVHKLNNDTYLNIKIVFAVAATDENYSAYKLYIRIAWKYGFSVFACGMKVYGKECILQNAIE